jgi:hypothetical protein
MEDKKSPNKIKRETEIFFLDKRRFIKWSDIKHLQLEDDDVIRSSWEEDEDVGHGYYVGIITRMVEETDEQYQKRLSTNEQDKERMKKSRYESYLRLKKEFELDKQTQIINPAAFMYHGNQ